MMVTTSTPATLLEFQTSALRTQLGGIFDGDADAVHDARVATRRIRELLRLLRFSPAASRGDEDLADAFASIGRALGRVRNVDVRIALIKELATHSPQAAPSLLLVRQHFEIDRLERMRRLIKTLERLGIEALLGVVTETRRGSVRMRLASAGWHGQVRGLVVERARAATEQIAHATGVYFPNRAHSARVAIKRLRYTAEILEATGGRQLDPSIKSLSKVQGILGDLHDRQDLADWLWRHRKRDGVDSAHVRVTREVLAADVQEMYRKYLSNRATARAACAEIDHIASTPRHTRALAIGTAVAAVSGVVWTRWALTPATPRSRVAASLPRVQSPAPSAVARLPAR